MRMSVIAAAIAPVFLVACEGVGGVGPDAFVTLPENVVAMAAPYQDLHSVKIDPVDGCYVYRHVGPVETTYLPLRTKNGRPVCTRAQDTETPAS